MRKANDALTHLGRQKVSLDQPLLGEERTRTSSREVPIIDDLSNVSTQEFIDSLSRLQKRILKLLTAGYSEQQIVRKSSLRIKQIERSINEIRKKANVFFELNLSESEVVGLAAPISKKEYL